MVVRTSLRLLHWPPAAQAIQLILPNETLRFKSQVVAIGQLLHDTCRATRTASILRNRAWSVSRVCTTGVAILVRSSLRGEGLGHWASRAGVNLLSPLRPCVIFNQLYTELRSARAGKSLQLWWIRAATGTPNLLEMRLKGAGRLIPCACCRGSSR